MPRKKKEQENKEQKQEEEKVKKEKKKEHKENKEETEDKKEKKEKKEEKRQEELAIPLGDYIKAAVHLGTRAVMPGMKKYVYRRKADGIAVLNTKKIDEKIVIAAHFLAQYEPENILVCCKRDAGRKALEAFGQALGVKTFAKYPAGIITNPNLEKFFEPKVIFVIDPWLDKNAIKDAVKIHLPILGLCDTNNITDYIDVLVPCNNKSEKSIGLVLYNIAKFYFEKKGIKKKLKTSDFYKFEEDIKERKKETRAKKNRY